MELVRWILRQGDETQESDKEDNDNAKNDDDGASEPDNCLPSEDDVVGLFLTDENLPSDLIIKIKDFYKGATLARLEKITVIKGKK